MFSTIVRSGEHSNQVSPSKPFEAVQNTFVRAQDLRKFIFLEEGLDDVRAEFHDVAGSVRVTHVIRLDTKFAVVLSRVRPKNVND